MKQINMHCDIDMNELACRIAEGCVGVKRADGATAQQALDSFKPTEKLAFMAAAFGVMEYITESVNNWKREN